MVFKQTDWFSANVLGTAVVARLVERSLAAPQVGGSNPIRSIIEIIDTNCSLEKMKLRRPGMTQCLRFNLDS